MKIIRHTSFLRGHISAILRRGHLSSLATNRKHRDVALNHALKAPFTAVELQDKAGHRLFNALRIHARNLAAKASLGLTCGYEQMVVRAGRPHTQTHKQ